MKKQEITVDIATRVVAEDEDFYIVHPGSDYSLYAEFERRSLVFLDFPDLRLDLKTRPDKADLRKAVVRSMDLRDWIRSGSGGAAPSRKEEDYENADFGRRIGRYVGAIERLYYDLKPGTIIIVPGPGLYDDVLIGQIEGKATLARNIKLYPGEMLPARRVRWIGRKTRAYFREEVRDRFGTPNPLYQLDRSLREDILKAGFDQYVIGGVYAARFRTTEADFSSFDDESIQVFVNLISGAVAAAELGETRAASIGFRDARQYLRDNREWRTDMAAAIESPGFIRFASEHITPLVIAAMFAIAVAASPGASIADTVHVINSAAGPDDQCAYQVGQHIADAMKLMKFDDLRDACVDIRDAKEDTGLSTSIKVVPNGTKP